MDIDYFDTSMGPERQRQRLRTEHNLPKQQERQNCQLQNIKMKSYSLNVFIQLISKNELVSRNAVHVHKCVCEVPVNARRGKAPYRRARSHTHMQSRTPPRPLWRPRAASSVTKKDLQWLGMARSQQP